jgi:hypothetical protein
MSASLSSSVDSLPADAVAADAEPAALRMVVTLYLGEETNVHPDVLQRLRHDSRNCHFVNSFIQCLDEWNKMRTDSMREAFVVEFKQKYSYVWVKMKTSNDISWHPHDQAVWDERSNWLLATDKDIAKAMQYIALDLYLAAVDGMTHPRGATLKRITQAFMLGKTKRDVACNRRKYLDVLYNFKIWVERLYDVVDLDVLREGVLYDWCAFQRCELGVWEALDLAQRLKRLILEQHGFRFSLHSDFFVGKIAIPKLSFLDNDAALLDVTSNDDVGEEASKKRKGSRGVASKRKKKPPAPTT